MLKNSNVTVLFETANRDEPHVRDIYFKFICFYNNRQENKSQITFKWILSKFVKSTSEVKHGEIKSLMNDAMTHVC